jgi:hypothetical protein
MDALLPLIVNLSSKNREYVVFVGAGFSKDAGIKSGWDILIETLRPIYYSENNITQESESDYKDIENWYMNHETYSKLGYSDILEIMKKGDIERREYLKQFFENEQPGEAHRQLAQMVAQKLVRFIFTTNFDDLIEKAVDELGVKYDVIYSDDVLSHSRSWDKIDSCRIYKLHGDYKAGKVRNTYKELESLDPKIAEDFQYIIDRHGLIVIGYSGRDEGVMKHFIDRKPDAYPFYWQYLQHPAQNSEYRYYYKLKDKYEKEYEREIIYIQNSSASDFLRQLNQGVEQTNKLIQMETDPYKFYSNFIVNSNEKKIRAESCKLIEEANRLFNENRYSEEKISPYLSRYELFESFIRKLDPILFYINELVKYGHTEDVGLMTTQILGPISKSYWDGDNNEFIKKSTPYYLVMILGSIFLKFGRTNLNILLYDIKMKDGYNNICHLMNEISYESEAWDYLASAKYDIDTQYSKYKIVRNHLLPKFISPDDFDGFHSYLLLSNVMGFNTFEWKRSFVNTSKLKDIFFDHFDKQIDSGQKATEFITRFTEKFKYGDDFGRTWMNIVTVINYLKSKFNLN